MAEEGSDLVLSALSEGSLAATSRIAYVECQAALARGGREGRLTARQLSAARRSLTERWEDLVVIELSPEVTRTAGQFVHEHALRAADAVHLASAASLAGGPSEETTFACWDRRLWEAGARIGFRMVPPAGPA